MKIKNHDDFPKLDHRTAPSFRAERDWVINSPPIPRARPGDGRHDQLGNFQTALLGRITPASTVAMIEAFRHALNLPFGLYDVAHTALEIERHDVKLAGGKQDQYAAAFGGINFIEFLPEDRVIVNPLRVSPAVLNELQTSIVLCFTGQSRDLRRDHSSANQGSTGWR